MIADALMRASRAVSPQFAGLGLAALCAIVWRVVSVLHAPTRTRVSVPSRNRGAAWLFAWALLSAGAPLSAQLTTGTIAGTVIDAQGGVVARATVTVTSETQGTRAARVETSPTGAYTVPGLSADVYRIDVALRGFAPLVHRGVRVSGGDRVVVDPLVLQVRGASEAVTVDAAAPLIQSDTGERSADIDSNAVDNLPVSTHDFQQLLAITPGVNGTARIGGGGEDNYMIDGVSVMDTGNNGLMGGLNLPVAAISEVKVLTSGYQAEYGRSSGMQISAVTRSGGNQFHWSFIHYQRDSSWNTNSWANARNGNPKAISTEADWGVGVGGPVGKPGGNNRLFFFTSQELRPRVVGHFVNHFRLPTMVERQGDFSQTLDQSGAVDNLVYDAASGLPKAACQPGDTRACFQAGGVLGRVPTDRLYGPGLALLNQYPLPNVAQAAGQGFNYSVTTPIQHTLAYTPVVRIDYQASPRLRLTAAWHGQNAQVKPTIGSLPGFNDTLQRFPLSFSTAFTANVTVTKTTFLEVTYGVTQNRLGAPPVTSYTNRDGITCPAALASAVPNCAMSDLALLYPDAGAIDPRVLRGTARSSRSARRSFRAARAACRRSWPGAPQARRAGFPRTAATAAGARRQA